MASTLDSFWPNRRRDGMSDDHLLDSERQTNQRRLNELRRMPLIERETHSAEIERLEKEQAQIEFECGCVGVDARSVFRDRPRRP